ncbi:MAG TPA: inositol monophosphatase family protein [Acidimicrobiales bacterium]|jgi:myo-inositol-1(or 4)-monophosphatase|nr:inositol monophosphatase family protein [Acidimicrobiales bacterium]
MTAAAPAPDPGELVELAVGAAERAVDLLVDGLGRARATVETKSTATDMVSEMDRASEELITSTLLGARPGDGLMAEEGGASLGTSGLRWVIDPLDGTTNYLYGHPGWAVSIAAEDATGVVAGVVADPMHDEVFTAARGRGAQRNGEPIACPHHGDLATALVATGFGYAAERRRAQAEVLVGLLPRVRDIRRMGAAAVDLCSVACGRVDAYFERGLAWWDLAAGALVAREAGALVDSIDGESPRAGPDAGSILAAGPGLFTTLRALLRSLGAHGVL